MQSSQVKPKWTKVLYKLNKNATYLMEISRNKHGTNTLYSLSQNLHRLQLNTIPRSCSKHKWRGGSGTTFQQQQPRLCCRYRHSLWCWAARRAIQSGRWWLFKNRVNLPDASADWAFNDFVACHSICLFMYPKPIQVKYRWTFGSQKWARVINSALQTCHFFKVQVRREKRSNLVAQIPFRFLGLM